MPAALSAHVISSPRLSVRRLVTHSGEVARRFGQIGAKSGWHRTGITGRHESDPADGLETDWTGMAGYLAPDSVNDSLRCVHCTIADDFHASVRPSSPWVPLTRILCVSLTCLGQQTQTYQRVEVVLIARESADLLGCQEFPFCPGRLATAGGASLSRD